MRAADLRLLERTGALFAQLFFIAAGVYLGNQADDWKQEREHRASARAALGDFRTEMAANRDRLRQYEPTYKAYADSLRVSEKRGDPAPRHVTDVFRRVGWHGLNPMTYGHTAWDLALATQSLSYLPRPLAFRIARLYTMQQNMQEMQHDVGATLFNPSSLDDARAPSFQFTFEAYLEDSLIQSRQVGAAYDRMIPAVDSALRAAPR